jgi:hypothetical protein
MPSQDWKLSSTDLIPIVYTFNMNIESSDIEIVNKLDIKEAYTQYPHYSFNDNQYKKGTLSTIPYTYSNNDYVIDVSLLNEIISFINNKKAKVIETPNGEIFKVSTSDASYKYMEGIISCPYTIKFSYIQIGNIV